MNFKLFGNNIVAVEGILDNLKVPVTKYKKGNLLGGAELLCNSELVLELKSYGANIDYILYNETIYPVLVNTDSVPNTPLTKESISKEERDSLKEINMFTMDKSNAYDIFQFVQNNDSVRDYLIELNKTIVPTEQDFGVMYDDEMTPVQELMTDGVDVELLQNFDLMTSIQQDTPESVLSYALPKLIDIMTDTFKLEPMNFFSPLPDSLRGLNWESNLSKEEDYCLEDIIGYTENDHLTIQSNEMEFYTYLKDMIDTAIKAYLPAYNKKNATGDKTYIAQDLIDMCYLPIEMITFFKALAMYLMIKNRRHCPYINFFPQYIKGGTSLGEDDEVDSTGGESVNLNTIYYVHRLPNIETDSSGEIISAPPGFNKDFRMDELISAVVMNGKDVYGWAELIIKLFRWGDRKPRYITIEGSKKMLDIEGMRLKEDKGLTELYVDEDGNDGFPVGFISSYTAIGHLDMFRNKLSEETYNNLLRTNKIIKPVLGLQYSNIMTKEDGEQFYVQRFTDFFTLVENLLKGTSHIKGISLDKSTGEFTVSQEIEEKYSALFNEEIPMIKATNELKAYVKDIVDNSYSVDTAKNMQAMALSLGNMHSANLSVFNMAEILFKDNSDTRMNVFNQFHLIKSKEQFKSILLQLSKLPPEEVLSVIVMCRWRLDYLYIMWSKCTTVKEVLEVTLQHIEEVISYKFDTTREGEKIKLEKLLENKTPQQTQPTSNLIQTTQQTEGFLVKSSAFGSNPSAQQESQPEKQVQPTTSTEKTTAIEFLTPHINAGNKVEIRPVVMDNNVNNIICYVKTTPGTPLFFLSPEDFLAHQDILVVKNAPLSESVIRQKLQGIYRTISVSQNKDNPTIIYIKEQDDYINNRRADIPNVFIDNNLSAQTQTQPTQTTPPTSQEQTKEDVSKTITQNFLKSLAKKVDSVKYSNVQLEEYIATELDYSILGMLGVDGSVVGYVKLKGDGRKELLLSLTEEQKSKIHGNLNLQYTQVFIKENMTKLQANIDRDIFLQILIRFKETIG